MSNKLCVKGGKKSNKQPDSEHGKNVSDIDKTPFEDAMNLIGIGKCNYRLLTVFIYSLLAATAEMFSIGIVTTAAQCDLELDVEKKGLLSSLPILGVIVSGHFWGFIADTRGRRFALIIGTSACCITGILAAFSNSWIYLGVIKFIGAIFASGTNAICFTIIGETTSLQKRHSYLMYALAGVLAFQAVNVPVAYPILNMTSFSYYMPILGFTFRPWRLYLLTIGFISGINLLLIVFYTFESPKFYFAIGEHEMGLKIMQKFYHMNTGNAMEDYPVKYVILNKDDYKGRQRNFLRSIWDQTTPLFSKKYFKTTMLIFLCGLPAYCVSPPLSIWWPFIMDRVSKSENPDSLFCEIFQINYTVTNSIGSSNTDNSSTTPICDDTVADITYITLSLFSVFVVIVTIGTSLVIKYIGKKWTFVINHLLCTILAVVVNYLNMYGGVIALVGISANVACMGIVTAYAIELFPTYMRAMAVCLTILSGRAVSMVFLNVIGAQLQNNCYNFMFVYAGLIACGGLVGLFLPSDREKNTVNAQNSEVEVKTSKTT